LFEDEERGEQRIMGRNELGMEDNELWERTNGGEENNE